MPKERDDRQANIIATLQQKDDPISGLELARLFQVTRQVVVHDIALLRAAGYPILSTPRGYLLESERPAQRKEMILSVSHAPELTGEELFVFVDFGLRVMNVQVEHPLYGELTGSLHLASRKDVEYFLDQVRQQKATLLSSLTDGDHMHKIGYDNETRVREAIEELRKKGITVYE